MTTTSSAPSSSAGDGGSEVTRPRSTPSSAREAATAGSGSRVVELAETARTRPLERWASRAAATRLRPSSATPRKTTTRAGRASCRPFPPPGTATSCGGVPARSRASAASGPLTLIPTTAQRRRHVPKKTPQPGPRFHADRRECCHFGDTGPVAWLSAVGCGCCSTPMRRFGVDERRARLGLRHHLAVPARTGVVEAARTDAIAVQQRRLLVDMIGRAGMADDPAGWIEDVEKATVKALEARGGANAPQGAKDHPPPAPQI